jgi:hypothetical protein
VAFGFVLSSMVLRFCAFSGDYKVYQITVNLRGY